VSTLTLSNAQPFSLRSSLRRLVATRKTALLLLALAVSLLAMFDVTAATNTGTALQAAYTSLDELANGYGKQILTLMGFVIAAVGYFAANSSSAVFKFIGYAIFLGAALGAATTLVGAVV